MTFFGPTTFHSSFLFLTLQNIDTSTMPRKKTVTNPDILEQSTMDKGTVLSSLNALVTDVFMDAQKPEGILRADAIKLRDIQIACCLNSPRMIGEPENIDLDGESKFLQVVFKMVNIVIKAKRKEPTADRVQRFLAGFLQYIQSKGEWNANSEIWDGYTYTKTIVVR